MLALLGLTLTLTKGAGGSEKHHCKQRNKDGGKALHIHRAKEQKGALSMQFNLLVLTQPAKNRGD